MLRLGALGALAFSVAALLQYTLPTPTFCAPGGGCDAVRRWASLPVAGMQLAELLPLLGVMGFTTLFVGSLVPQRAAARVIGALAVLGGAIAAVLIALQATTIGAWCWLCVGVDVSALVAGGAGVALLARSRHADPSGPTHLRSPAWAAAILAVGAPLAWALALPDPELPVAVQRLYRPGALNVVELVDFECPYCRALHPVVKRALADAGGEQNLVRVIVPLAFHPHARDAGHAYYCAERMGQREPMADRLFAAELSRSGLLAEARALDLDAAEFEACLDDPTTAARLAADERLALEAGNQGLPTTYIGSRTLLGFHPQRGEAQVREAVVAAREGEGSRTRVWPAALVVLAAAAAYLWGRRRAA